MNPSNNVTNLSEPSIDSSPSAHHPPKPEIRQSLVARTDENPCRWCCPLVYAAKTIAILNVLNISIHLLIILAIEDGDEKTYDHWFHGRSTEKNGAFYFESCLLQHWINIAFRPTHHLKFIYYTLLVSWLLDGITSITFLSAVQCNIPENRQILFSNMFMWFNFCCPGIILYFLLFLTVVTDGESVEGQCLHNPYLWVFTLSILALAVTEVVFNGLVARGYKKEVRRLMNQQATAMMEQGQSGEVPAEGVMEGMPGQQQTEPS